MNAKSDQIRQLNDEFRTGQLPDGKVMVTAGIKAMGETAVSAIYRQVREFDDFSEDNDPYHEHDFGKVDYEDTRIFWKIDYYDLTLTKGSEDPADPSITTRVLTIMRAEEY